VSETMLAVFVSASRNVQGVGLHNMQEPHLNQVFGARCCGRQRQDADLAGSLLPDEAPPCQQPPMQRQQRIPPRRLLRDRRRRSLMQDRWRSSRDCQAEASLAAWLMRTWLETSPLAPAESACGLQKRPSLHPYAAGWDAGGPPVQSRRRFVELLWPPEALQVPLTPGRCQRCLPVVAPIWEYWPRCHRWRSRLRAYCPPSGGAQPASGDAAGTRAQRKAAVDIDTRFLKFKSSLRAR